MTHRTLWVLLILLTAFPARAADDPKPNALTPKEIADGWLLLFDGESTFGWQIDGESKVVDGQLVLGGSKATTATLTTSFPTCEARVDYHVEGVAANFKTLSNDKNKGTGAFSMVGGAGSVLTIKIMLDATEPFGTEVKHGAASGKPSRIDAVIKHHNLRPTMRFDIPSGTTIALSNFKLRPTETKTLFNGKDLTGWKVFDSDKAKAKTEFSVTKEGELHLKNGPGDIQTTDQFDDFVLQVECKTNGDKLNSGVFFRCRPGEYQNGYEAQIHNGFDAAKPKEYVVEEYDPKTNELKDKNKVKSDAIDYGTGAIYRRIPARKQASKDNEWFTMTVVAQGRHIATWVNGIGMVDWTDNRPLKDNARNGCRLEKGNISLQGHDPTTDLLFRNIRIAEMGK
jgi:hypothetical protein